MLLPHTYGDELCVLSLASLFQVRVDVYTPAFGVQSFQENLSPIISLAYNGQDHFDVILLKSSSRLLPREPSPQIHSPDVHHCTSKVTDPIFSLQKNQSAKSKNCLTLLSINFASWELHASSAITSGADILAIQETRLSALRQEQQNKALAARPEPWHAIWGKPTGDPTNKYAKPARQASGKSAPGCVAILAKQSLSLLESDRDTFPARTLQESTRWCAAAIPLSSKGALTRRFLHICSFYGIVNKRNDAKHTQNERLLKELFCHTAMYGQQPVVICLDANTTMQRSLVLSQALATGQWIDVGAAFANPPEPTYASTASWDKISTGKGITRPDLVLANPAAFSLCKSFRLRRDLAVKGHLGLEVTFFILHAMEIIRVYAPPKAFTGLPDNKKAKTKVLSGPH